MLLRPVPLPGKMVSQRPFPWQSCFNSHLAWGKWSRSDLFPRACHFISYLLPLAGSERRTGLLHASAWASYINSHLACGLSLAKASRTPLPWQALACLRTVRRRGLAHALTGVSYFGSHLACGLSLAKASRTLSPRASYDDDVKLAHWRTTLISYFQLFNFKRNFRFAKKCSDGPKRVVHNFSQPETLALKKNLSFDRSFKKQVGRQMHPNSRETTVFQRLRYSFFFYHHHRQSTTHWHRQLPRTAVRILSLVCSRV